MVESATVMGMMFPWPMITDIRIFIRNFAVYGRLRSYTCRIFRSGWLDGDEGGCWGAARWWSDGSRFLAGLENKKHFQLKIDKEITFVLLEVDDHDEVELVGCRGIWKKNFMKIFFKFHLRIRVV